MARTKTNAGEISDKGVGLEERHHDLRPRGMKETMTRTQAKVMSRIRTKTMMTMKATC